MSNECKALLSQDVQVSPDAIPFEVLALVNYGASNTAATGYRGLLLSKDNLNQNSGSLFADNQYRLNRYSGLSVSNDGKWFACTSQTGSGSSAGGIFKLNATTKLFDRIVSFAANNGADTAQGASICAFSPDNEFLVVSGGASASGLNFYKNNGGLWNLVATRTASITQANGAWLKTGRKYTFAYIDSNNYSLMTFLTIDPATYAISVQTLAINACASGYLNLSVLKFVAPSISTGDHVEYLAYTNKATGSLSYYINIVKIVTDNTGATTITKLTQNYQPTGLTGAGIKTLKSKRNNFDNDFLFAEAYSNNSPQNGVYVVKFDRTTEQLSSAQSWVHGLNARCGVMLTASTDKDYYIKPVSTTQTNAYEIVKNDTDDGTFGVLTVTTLPFSPQLLSASVAFTSAHGISVYPSAEYQ